MPEERVWATFFGPEETLPRLGLTKDCRDVVEFGCGYGTFTIPTAKIVHGTVYALDIDPTMIAATKERTRQAGLSNVVVRQCDFLKPDLGLPDGSADYAMLFNILHAENPELLLNRTYQVLRPEGVLAIMHWNYDPATPRGPRMEIRTAPRAMLRLGDQRRFRFATPRRYRPAAVSLWHGAATGLMVPPSQAIKFVMSRYIAGMKNLFRFSMRRLFVAVTLFCFGVSCCMKDLPPHPNTGTWMGGGFSTFALAIGALLNSPSSPHFGRLSASRQLRRSITSLNCFFDKTLNSVALDRGMFRRRHELVTIKHTDATLLLHFRRAAPRP